MRLTLQRKFFLALSLLLLLLLSLFVASSRFALQSGLGGYVAEIQLSRMDWVVENLQKAYARSGSWRFLQDDPGAWRTAQFMTEEFSGARRPPEGEPGLPPQLRGPDPKAPPDAMRLRREQFVPELDVPPRFGPHPDGHYGPNSPNGPEGPVHRGRGPESIYSRLALLDASGQKVLAGAQGPIDAFARRPLAHNGRTVGYLALSPVEGLAPRADQAFIAQQSTLLLAIGLGGLFVAVLLSMFMARRWLRPLDELARGAQAVAEGRLDVAVPVRGDDELAQLTETFNAMAARLASIEQSRQRWLADVAHELRTPVAAMRGEIEALQDGVRSFDGATLQRLHAQAMRLGKLVEDLRLVLDETHTGGAIAWADVRPLQVLLEAIELMQPRLQEGRIDVAGPAQLRQLQAARRPAIRGDAARLMQVFTNLLENTARYTHPGGRLLVHAHIEGEVPGARLAITLDDTAPAPAEADLPRLFERFFRGDASRNRARGGSGLGLSICRTIVEAHGGRIQAQLSPLGGLRILLEFPLP